MVQRRILGFDCIMPVCLWLWQHIAPTLYRSGGEEQLQELENTDAVAK